MERVEEGEEEGNNGLVGVGAMGDVGGKDGDDEEVGNGKDEEFEVADIVEDNDVGGEECIFS